MARPLRIEFPGALYHVTSRGDRREDIFADDDDRVLFLEVLGQVVGEFNWLCLAYCLMGNHYHLVVETPDGHLSRGMRQLNGVFTQRTNRRHGLAGHVFQGRYKAILVDADAHLLELARYVVLNPVRAGMTAQAGDWPWSSFRATVEEEAAPPWLATGSLLARFDAPAAEAVRRYRAFVAQGIGGASVWRHLNRQVYLGDDRFVAQMQALSAGSGDDGNIPKVQRRPPAAPLAAIAAAHGSREAAMAAAHATGEYSYQQIADFFGVHFTTVGRIVRAAKQAGGGAMPHP